MCPRSACVAPRSRLKIVHRYVTSYAYAYMCVCVHGASKGACAYSRLGACVSSLGAHGQLSACGCSLVAAWLQLGAAKRPFPRSSSILRVVGLTCKLGAAKHTPCSGSSASAMRAGGSTSPG